jgi:4'-phosphopantetheinyl transferase
MPIVKHTNLNQNTILAIWKISESHAELRELLAHTLVDEGLNKHDNIHWLASRVMLSRIIQSHSIVLQKDEFNKPSLKLDGKPYAVSISHSFGYAAIIISNTHQVAVDLEKIDERVLRVVTKFLRNDEQFASNNTLLSTIVWSAKETLYKYYSRKEIDFKLNLQIEPFAPTTNLVQVTGHIVKNPYQITLPISVEQFDGYVLTYAVSLL